MATAFLTRPATPGDMAAVRFLDSQLGEPEVVILVAEREGEVVGYVYAALEPPNWKELRAAAGLAGTVSGLCTRALAAPGLAAPHA